MTQFSEHEQTEFYFRVVALPWLTAEHRLTMNVMEAIPANQDDYRPHPDSRSGLDVAWHIAWAENMFLDAVASGQFNLSGSVRAKSMRSPADVAAWYAETFKKNFSRLTKLSTEQLIKVLDYRRLFRQPAAVYLHTALVHSIHHRGQLSVYLRPMGAEVPSIYGESFDAVRARQSAHTSAGTG